mmetsp:Transcript_27333/g.45579  ORF Transcript_27333/g.45579 Transcript_27333/m.45579 type:complete len:324 (+) Transcript_27333:74-1045(+)|eukprot:CAMPEP_0119315938 /NCGR_PEP_ID=MMETSP1333-20130426/37846_1 /TAXON_ID=418940 /ORGANISM="Scyphosphaera apsteinii, Strain RCC1455" /LENGTH=323 /DNA_ID=CAMNT_0007321443 /DNA_START=63 /DNA_END=1034 /DNA_ORIENTATION=-
MGCGASVEQPPRQLVLLGGGESGKTTIFKQIQILHGTGFDDKADEYKDVIQNSAIRSVQTLLAALPQAGVSSLTEANKAAAERCAQLSPGALTPDAAEDIAAVWNDPAIAELLSTVKLDLDDNAKFFLNRVEKIASTSYKPITEEILKVRDPTRSIDCLDFQHKKAKFRVIDVGGQRMERPKWNLTGEVTAVIFVVSLIEYNQVLREDVKQNRLKESINLFDIACNRRYPDKPIILFLNKEDIFEEMIKTVDLKVCFPTYKGGCDKEAALAYIKYKFCHVRKDKDKRIYVFVTTATDTRNMEHIIDSLVDIVEKQNLDASGFS